MPKTIIAMATERGEFIQLEDGFYYYWPKGSGAISPVNLRAIAAHLDDMNACWQAVCEYTADRQNTQMWVAGIQLIDATIAALQAAGVMVLYGDDGGDKRIALGSRAEAVALVASVAESELYFRHKDHVRNSMMRVIPGNGVEAICDHSEWHADFLRVLQAVLANAEATA